MPVSKELLEKLACPECRGELKVDKKTEKLVCQSCNSKFDIDEIVPEPEIF